MSMIKVEGLSFSYPSSYDPIFQDVSFQIDSDWKLGFIGRNGRGKTTFLKLLLGEYEYSGKITAALQFDYFPYPVQEKTRKTAEVLYQVCPDAEEWELLREFNALTVDEEVLLRPFETLSNGEQTKVLLAALFLNQGHFLLIDEPTNHLDLQAREIVSAYLKKKKGFILVSHDRSFMDGCVDHILSINRANIEVQRGNFCSWWENKQRQDAQETAANERLKKEIDRLSTASKRSADWSGQVERSKKGSKNSGSKLDRGFVGHKAAKMMKQAKNIAARQEEAATQKAGLLKNIETAESLKLHPLPYHADVLLRFSQLCIQYGQNPVCRDISFELRQGERVVLAGKNGSGKSSLLKLLLGQPITYSGSLSVGSQLKISYVPQDPSFLQGTLSAYAAEQEIDESLFKASLRKLGFERVQFEKDMKDFSAGQKKKVLLAKSLCEEAHLYLWDEPLNYIDVYSRIQIEELLAAYQPTMLFVEHDRAFQEAVATRTIQI